MNFCLKNPNQKLGMQQILPPYEDIRAEQLIYTQLKKLPPHQKTTSISTFRKAIDSSNCINIIGECAELFSMANPNYLSKLTSYISELKQGRPHELFILRHGGQYAKPRSSFFEDNSSVLSYFGDLINSSDFNEQARKPNSMRMLDAYNASFHTQQQLLGHYFAHEFLHTSYENCFIKEAAHNKYLLNCHLPWIGYRTNDLNSVQVSALSTIKNPIAIKIGPLDNVEKIKMLYAKLNLSNEKNKIFFILRLGFQNAHQVYLNLLTQLSVELPNAIWICDPLHGNTIKNRYKFRFIEHIKIEMAAYCQAIKQLKIRKHGFMLEVSPEAMHECLDQHDSFHSYTCDPRLSPSQLFELLKFKDQLFL